MATRFDADTRLRLEAEAGDLQTGKGGERDARGGLLQPSDRDKAPTAAAIIDRERHQGKEVEEDRAGVRRRPLPPPTS